MTALLRSFQQIPFHNNTTLKEHGLQFVTTILPKYWNQRHVSAQNIKFIANASNKAAETEEDICRILTVCQRYEPEFAISAAALLARILVISAKGANEINVLLNNNELMISDNGDDGHSHSIDGFLNQCGAFRIKKLEQACLEYGEACFSAITAITTASSVLSNEQMEEKELCVLWYGRASLAVLAIRAGVDTHVMPDSVGYLAKHVADIVLDSDEINHANMTTVWGLLFEHIFQMRLFSDIPFELCSPHVESEYAFTATLMLMSRELDAIVRMLDVLYTCKAHKICLTMGQNSTLEKRIVHMASMLLRFTDNAQHGNETSLSPDGLRAVTSIARNMSHLLCHDSVSLFESAGTAAALKLSFAACAEILSELEIMLEAPRDSENLLDTRGPHSVMCPTSLLGNTSFLEYNLRRPFHQETSVWSTTRTLMLMFAFMGKAKAEKSTVHTVTEEVAHEDELKLALDMINAYVHATCATTPRLIPLPFLFDSSTVFFRGLGDRDGKQRSILSVFDLLSNGLIAADLTTANATGQSSSKSGQIFFTQCLETAMAYLSKNFEDGALVAIHADFVNSAILRGRCLCLLHSLVALT